MVSEQLRRDLWRDEIAGVQAAVSRAAEIQTQAPPGSLDARQATADALRAYRALVHQLQRDPTLHRETPVDLVSQAVAEGVERAERIERRAVEVVREQGMGW